MRIFDLEELKYDFTKHYWDTLELDPILQGVVIATIGKVQETIPKHWSDEVHVRCHSKKGVTIIFKVADPKYALELSKTLAGLDLTIKHLDLPVNHEVTQSIYAG